MAENNKFDQFNEDLYEDDDFELESETLTKEKVKNIDEDNTGKNEWIKDIDNSSIPSNDWFEDDVNDSKSSSNWFELESDNKISIEDEIENIDTNNTTPDNSNNKKKLIIIGTIITIVIIFLIIIISLISWNDKEPRKVEQRKIITQETIENDTLQENINTDISEDTKVDSSVDNIEDDIINTPISETDNSSTWILDEEVVIKVNNNSWDEVINITEAILSPSDIKISMNNLWEFDWVEEDTSEWTSFIKIKENSLIIPTVSKNNFVPKLEIEVLNTKTNFTTSDLIKIEFNILLNSKTLNYSMTKKIYDDKDFIIDITLNEISSDIVSIEENLIKEELTIPINLMNKGAHTVWFKINNYPVKSYKYNIR